jgi:hypothetical protein
MKKMIIAGLLTLALAGLTSAATTVTFTGSQDGTNWYVWAKVTGTPNNDGFSFADIRFAGVDINTANLDTPKVADNWYKNTNPKGWQTSGSYGFGQQNVIQPLGGADPTAVEVLLGMDPALASTVYDLRHLGQQSVTFTYHMISGATSTAMDTVTVSYDPAYGMLVADGALLTGGTIPSFLPASVMGANVWAPGGNGVLDVSTGIQLQAQPDLHFLPEPATLALLGIGGVATILRRRRRRS